MLKQFKYVAVNLKKEKFKGIFLAEDPKDLEEQLAKQNLFLVSYKKYSSDTPSSFLSVTGKVKISELTSFCRQFSIMITAGMPLLKCLDALKSQSYSSLFHSVLVIIYDDVKGGMMLSDALNKHSKIFPHFFRNMVKIGEESGQLENVFTSLAEYYENDQEMKAKLKSALSYPIMLLALIIGIVTLLMVLVVPNIIETLTSMDVPIEGLTKGIYDIYLFFKDDGLYLLAGLVCFVALLFLYGLSPKGKIFFDRLKVKLPGIGKINVSMITSRFAKSFGLLLSSGLDLADALDKVQIIIGNRYIVEKFKKATEEVKNGASLAVSFGNYKIFPLMMLQMLATGEQTASIDEILMRSAKFFDGEVTDSINKFTKTIQPIMIVIMGGIVGLMFIAVYSPILSIMNNLL